MDGPLRKLLSCHHIWLVNLSAWQVSACQLVSLSSYASLGACNLVFVHPKWEIGRQVDISPLLGHQLTAEKKQKITSTCRTLVGNPNESVIMILSSLTHIFRSKSTPMICFPCQGGPGTEGESFCLRSRICKEVASASVRIETWSKQWEFLILDYFIFDELV